MSTSTDDTLLTPILIKDRDDLDWPERAATYVLARNGLFMVRRHPFFESCAPAARWPSELRTQQPHFRARFPLLPQRLFETVVGFFTRIADLHNCEAGAHLVWDRQTKEIVLAVPEQVATVSIGWAGKHQPIGLRYGTPVDLPPEQFVFGDIHSHVDMPAYASGTDVDDEQDLPGLHIVLGRIHQDPPDIHVEAVVDGARFRLTSAEVLAGYESRNMAVPQEWIDRVEIEVQSYGHGGSGGGSSYGSQGGPSDLPFAGGHP